MTKGTLMYETTHNLGLAIQANLPKSRIPLKVQEYFLQHKEKLQEDLRHGFFETLPADFLGHAMYVSALDWEELLKKEQEENRLSISSAHSQRKSPNGYVCSNLDFWLDKCQKFTKEYLKINVDLRKLFCIPNELPYESVIPVFNPGRLTNRDAIKKALINLGLRVDDGGWDVMDYENSGKGYWPTLCFINNSINSDDTVEYGLNEFVASKKNWLGLQGYALAAGLHYFVTGMYLDEGTYTLLPSTYFYDRDESRQVVAYGGLSVHHDYLKPTITFYRSESIGADCGVRKIVPVYLRK
jgi:hypothetical protein